MISLLDVNVLLALLDTDHLFHGRARAWLTESIAQGWATCPITQAGYVRVVSGPRYPAGSTVSQAIGRLAEAMREPHHTFWPCDVSLAAQGAVAGGRLLGPGQVTDVYLLALAVAHGGRLVTLDRRVPLTPAPGATAANLVVL
ncbi:MAG: PIN domain-containing protein [Bifidobacteriaceae bacterium]|nr:PIN domain-containing protein [Bifidobacteriaceae bacterium]